MAFTNEFIQHNTELLIQASKIGDFNEVKNVLRFSNPKLHDSEALRIASENGHSDIVQLLLPFSDHPARNSPALLWAARNGHLECVQILLSDMNTQDATTAMRLAAGKGHIECVKLLLPVSNPKAQNSFALECAAISQFADIIKLLIPVSDYHLVLNKLVNLGTHDTTLFQQCIHEHEALQQKERLHNNLVTIDKNKTDPTKRKM